MSDLPKLPTRNVIIDGLWEEVRGPYTEEDMRAYALAAVAMEREACAKVCDELPLRDPKQGFWVAGWSDGVDDCAAAIRARSNKCNSA